MSAQFRQPANAANRHNGKEKTGIFQKVSGDGGDGGCEEARSDKWTARIPPKRTVADAKGPEEKAKQATCSKSAALPLVPLQQPFEENVRYSAAPARERGVAWEQYVPDPNGMWIRRHGVLILDQSHLAKETAAELSTGEVTLILGNTAERGRWTPDGWVGSGRVVDCSPRGGMSVVTAGADTGIRDADLVIHSVTRTSKEGAGRHPSVHCGDQGELSL